MSGDSAYAAAPFDHAKADIILRSSDKVDFRVFKLFLSLASPAFETLFNTPQPVEESEDQEIKDGLAVVPMAEDSKALDALLRFCYPCTLAEDPSLEALQDALSVLNAAMKYSLGVIEKKARQAIVNPKILEAEPLRCFAIAHQGGLREETLLAAKHTLTQPLIPAWFQEIALINATDLLSLLTYHRRCGEAVYALRLDLSWITSHYGSAEACNWLSGQVHGQYQEAYDEYEEEYDEYEEEYDQYQHYSTNCGCTNTSSSRYRLFQHPALQWWEDFMEETFAELRDKPCQATVQTFADKTVQAVKNKNCQGCSPRVAEGMRGFVALLGGKIEEVVSGIELELNF